MLNNSRKKGFALGALVALVSTLFGAVPASQAAGTESGLIVNPAQGTSYTMVVTEDFVLTTRLGTGVSADYKNALKYQIEKPAGYGLSISTTVSALTNTYDLDSKVYSDAWNNTFASANAATVSAMLAATTVSVETPATPTVTPGYFNQLRIQPSSLSGITSVSPGVVVTVTAFLDLAGSGSPANQPSTSVTVTFVPWSGMGASIGLTQPIVGNTWATASAAISGVNAEQLLGNFELAFESTNDGRTNYAAASSSGEVSASALITGTFSHSEAIAAASASRLVAASISAVLYYNIAGSYTPAEADKVAVSKLGVQGAFTYEGVTFSAVAGDNLKVTSPSAIDTRVNSEFTIHAYAYTGSAVFTGVGTSLQFNVAGLSTEKSITVNGVTYTDSAKLPTTSSAIALAAGKQAIKVNTVGFAGTETITMVVTSVNYTALMTITPKTPTWTLVGDSNGYATAKPGVESSFNYTVKDQFGVVSNRTNQRLAVTVTGANFSTSDTVSYTVTSGKAVAKATTKPATATGSATVTVTLQTQNIDTGTWESGTTSVIALTVTESSAVFSAAVTATESASVSYDTWSWSGVITGTTSVPGARVMVSAAGMVFYDTVAEVSASDTIEIRSGSGGSFTLKAASKTAGLYTISYTVDGTSTTSNVTIDPAGADRGNAVTYNVSTIAAGSTAVVTGTLVDVNGNPVAASISVTYVGTKAGIAVGTYPTTTNADGEFSINVLTGASDGGTAALTVVVAKSGIMTAAKTFVQTITVGDVAASPSADQKLTVGSFKGYVAIYTLGYTGQKLSAKVAGKWLVVEDLERYERVVRNTGAGYTIKVDLYIDGEFVRSETITTK